MLASVPGYESWHPARERREVSWAHRNKDVSKERILILMLHKSWLLLQQCSGSVTFWYGSGSEDSYLWLTEMDRALFISDFQDAQKKFFFVFCLILFEDIFTSFSKIKIINSHKTVEIKVFLAIFARWWKNPDPYLWRIRIQNTEHWHQQMIHWLQQPHGFHTLLFNWHALKKF